MKIGLSYWGFIWDWGIVDTPDGFRPIRKQMINEFLRRGYEIYLLQEIRGKDFINCYKNNIHVVHPGEKFPDLDFIYMEWRWPIEGRNFHENLHMTDVNKQNWIDIVNEHNLHSDYYREIEILWHYYNSATIIFIHDKDLKITKEDEELLFGDNVIILEPSFKPSKIIKERKMLMYSWDDTLYSHNINEIISLDPCYVLGYIGSNYERDNQISKYLNYAGKTFDKRVHAWGNWTKYPAKLIELKNKWPYIIYHDRLSYKEVEKLYPKLTSTIILSKDNYAENGFMAVRTLEPIYHKIPVLGVEEHYKIDRVLMPEMIVSQKKLINKLYMICELSQEERIDLIVAQTEYFRKNVGSIFDLKNNINALEVFYREAKR